VQGRLLKSQKRREAGTMDKVILILLGCAAAIVRELAEDD